MASAVVALGVIRVVLDGLGVVFYCLLEVLQLGVAFCSVEIAFVVAFAEVYGFCEIFNSGLKVFNVIMAQTSAIVGTDIRYIIFNNCVKFLYGELPVTTFH